MQAATASSPSAAANLSSDAAAQLQLCRELCAAVALAASQQAHTALPAAVPASFNAALLEGLQHLMLCAVQLQHAGDLQDVRGALMAALRLVSHVNSLGPIEAFFTAQELRGHYQHAVDAAAALHARCVCVCPVGA
jgi:hypothetical protein